MAGRDLTYTIGVDASDAAAGLRKLEGAVRSTMRTVEDELEDGATAGQKLAESLDRVAAQSKEDLSSAAVAAEELQRALRDAGSGLEVGDAIASLQRMGLSFDEITQDADTLAVSLKNLGDVRAEGVQELDAIAPGLATKLDNVERSASSSRSALANMIGNSAQTMGDSLGIVGDLGVGIGQLGEYAADARLEGEGMGSVFKNMAGVVGPMAALAAATKLVADVMASRSESAAAATAQQELLTEAYKEGGDAATNYARALNEAGKIEVALDRHKSAEEVGGLVSLYSKLAPIVTLAGEALGLFGEATADLAPMLSRAGVSTQEWADAVTGGSDAYKLFAAGLAATSLSADDQKTVLGELADAQEANAVASDNASKFNTVFGDTAEEAAAKTEELARAQQEAAEAADAQAIAVAGAADSLLEVTSAAAEVERRSDALSDLFDVGDAPAEAASATRDIAEAIGGLATAAEGVDLSDALDPANLGADKLLDALDGLRPQVQAKIAEAFAAGGPEAATAVADDYVAQIVAALGGQLSPEKVKELLGIGDLTTTLSVALDASSVARAKSELEVLVGIGGETPFTASLKLAVDAGQLSGEAARAIAEWGLAEEGVKVPLDPVTDPAALAEAQAFMSSFAASNPVTQPLVGDASGVTDAATDAAGQVAKTPATQDILANTDDAEAGIASTKDTAANTKPIVDVDANVQAAILTMRIIQFVAAALAPKVVVDADIAPAMADIATVAAQRPRVPATVYVADYPTAGEIQAMIGRPRIPIDIVVGTSVRITGVRD